MRRLALVLLGAALGGSFYMALIDSRALPELYLMAAVAVLAGLAFVVSREEGVAEGSIGVRMLSRAWRALAGIPLQIAVVSWEALAQVVQRKPARGEFRAVRFRAGPEQPRDIGRRAMAEALGSIAPNTIVIGVDPDEDLLLVHQLRRQGDAGDLDVLKVGR